MLLLDPLLLIRFRDDVLERVDALLFQFDAQLLRRLLDDARWQIDLQSQFLADCHAIRLGKNDRFRDFLTICLISTIVFELDMEVKTAFGGVRFGAFGIGAGKTTLDLIGAPTDVLFPSREVSLPSQLLQVLLIVVILLHLEDGFEQLVSVFRNVADLGHHLLITRVQFPISLEIVVARVILRQLKTARAIDRLVKADLLRVVVLAWVLHGGHVLHFARRLWGNLTEARYQIIGLQELEVGSTDGIGRNVPDRVVGRDLLTLQLICLEEGLL